MQGYHSTTQSFPTHCSMDHSDNMFTDMVSLQSAFVLGGIKHNASVLRYPL